MNFRNAAKRLEDDEVFLVYLHIFYPNMLRYWYLGCSFEPLHTTVILLHSNYTSNKLMGRNELKYTKL